MRSLTVAGLLLAFLVGGCAQMGSTRSDSPRTTSSMRSDPANYHHAEFGEQNNEPFQGVYPGQ